MGLFRKSAVYFLLALAPCVLASTAHAEQHNQTIYLAHPDAVDGVTLTDGSGRTYRLDAVSPPLSQQTCATEDGASVNCAQRSRVVLEQFASSVLTCISLSQEHASHTVRCRDAMGRDLGARLVKSGWALPDRATSHRYIFDEMEAEALKQGVWRVRAY
ncbi:MAG: hypothetical protein AAFP99_02695 [Pseudomonadota bacterium]